MSFWIEHARTIDGGFVARALGFTVVGRTRREASRRLLATLLRHAAHGEKYE